MTKRRIKQICLILVCVIAFGAVFGAVAPKISLDLFGNAFNRVERLSLDDYTLVDAATFPQTQLSEPTWVEYTREAHSTKVLSDGYRITCNLSTTERYDNGTKKGDYGLSHQTESSFYPYHNFISTFKLRGMTGNKTLKIRMGLVFSVPSSLGYSKNIFYCNVISIHNDGTVWGVDPSTQNQAETEQLFSLKADEYMDIAVKHAADGTIKVYLREKLVYTTHVPTDLKEQGHLLGVQRAFYFFTADGVDSNVGASIDIQDLRVYALSEEYDKVHK